jgi:hypothetical protein
MMEYIIDGMVDGKISVTKYAYASFDDNPSSHRWRAWWASGTGDWRDGLGIELRCYPVVRATNAGAWIAHHAYWNGANWKNIAAAKWVKDGSGSAWAKPTQDDAVRSLAVRLSRWAEIQRNSVHRLKAAAVTLQKLRPDLAMGSASILETFSGVELPQSTYLIGAGPI